jgi:hypothetical protein
MLHYAAALVLVVLVLRFGEVCKHGAGDERMNGESK